MLLLERHCLSYCIRRAARQDLKPGERPGAVLRLPQEAFSSFWVPLFLRFVSVATAQQRMAVNQDLPGQRCS